MGGLAGKLSKFFTRDRLTLPTDDDGNGAATAGATNGANGGIGLLRHPSGEEFLWRPVLAGMISFTDVSESRVDLADLALMNELLDLQHYNDRVLTEARQHQQPAEFVVPPAFRR